MLKKERFAVVATCLFNDDGRFDWKIVDAAARFICKMVTKNVECGEFIANYTPSIVKRLCLLINSNDAENGLAYVGASWALCAVCACGVLDLGTALPMQDAVKTYSTLVRRSASVHEEEKIAAVATLRSMCIGNPETQTALAITHDGITPLLRELRRLAEAVPAPAMIPPCLHYSAFLQCLHAMLVDNEVAVASAVGAGVLDVIALHLEPSTVARGGATCQDAAVQVLAVICKHSLPARRHVFASGLLFQLLRLVAATASAAETSFLQCKRCETGESLEKLRHRACDLLTALAEDGEAVCLEVLFTADGMNFLFGVMEESSSSSAMLVGKALLLLLLLLCCGGHACSAALAESEARFAVVLAFLQHPDEQIRGLAAGVVYEVASKSSAALARFCLVPKASERCVSIVAGASCSMIQERGCAALHLLLMHSPAAIADLNLDGVLRVLKRVVTDAYVTGEKARTAVFPRPGALLYACVCLCTLIEADACVRALLSACGEFVAAACCLADVSFPCKIVRRSAVGLLRCLFPAALTAALVAERRCQTVNGILKLGKTMPVRPAGESYCCICSSEDEDEGGYMYTCCFHLFHQKCLSTWILKKDTCPLCVEPVLSVFQSLQHKKFRC